MSRGAGLQIEVRRVYDDLGGRPGEYRVLVDRLWPRGVAKTALVLDHWAKELAPSTDLRRWYGHEPARFSQFKDHYLTELRHPEASEAAASLLREASARTRLVLLTATKDVEHSGATVLASHLRRRRPRLEA